MELKFGYVYLTTNLINNKKYIGKKHSKVFVENYFGSGKLILRALEKYSRENFVSKIICWCETEEELNKMERFYIKEVNADLDKNYYNLAIGGEGFVCRGINNGMYGREHTIESRKIISKNHSDVSGKNNPMFGTDGGFKNKKHTIESRIKMSENTKGVIRTESHSKNISKGLSKTIEQLNPNTNEVIKEFQNAYIAANELKGIGRTSIANSCHTGRVIKNYLFRYKE